MRAMSYHVRLASGFMNLRIKELVNLERSGLDQIVQRWREEQPLVIDGRTWLPARTRITIYEGPPLTSAQRSFGQAWSNAMQFGENVTSAALDDQLPREQERQAPAAQHEVSHQARAKEALTRYSSVLGALLVVAGGPPATKPATRTGREKLTRSRSRALPATYRYR